jgi:hypothetical protein
MNQNRNAAETQLEVTLQEAVEKGTVKVRVTDDAIPPQPLPQAQVEVSDGTDTVSGMTDDDGEVVLEIDFSGLAPLTPKTVTVAASQSGFTPSAKTTIAIAIATIDVHLALVAE